jgi:hypothetical protein
MAGPPPPEVAEDKRAIMREVALTYRRVDRLAKAEGAKPPEQHHRAYEAAHAKYVELDPDAPADRLDQSRIVTNMIATAIRADSWWFWHGPDV